MDFYLTETAASRSVHFPMNPQRVTASTGARMATLETISLGDIQMPRGTQAARISWEARLPGAQRARHPYMKDWRAPGEILADLQAWRNGGTRLQLLITETPINIAVYISTLNHTWAGGHGDAEYSIELVQAKDLLLYTETEWQRKGAQPSTPSTITRPAPSAPASYTVVSGDTLWGIAKRLLGDGSRYKEIYALNRSVIGPDPNLILPGQTLRIPDGGGSTP